MLWEWQFGGKFDETSDPHIKCGSWPEKWITMRPNDFNIKTGVYH